MLGLFTDLSAAMTWERVILVLSLVANGVLGIALFFKGALNDMLTHWYKERTKRHDKDRDLLVELNQRMAGLQRDYFQMLVSLGLQHQATTRQDRALAERTFNETTRSLRTTNEFLERHDIEFSPHIRDLIRELRQTMVLPADAVRGALPGAEVMRRSNEINAATESIRAEIRNLIGR